MRSPRNLLIAAAVLIVAGIALIRFDSEETGSSGVSMGDEEGDGYLSTFSIAFDNAWLVTEQAAFGYALIWLGTLLVAGVVGHRLLAEPSSGEAV